MGKCQIDQNNQQNHVLQDIDFFFVFLYDRSRIKNGTEG